jgi:hypothetical protein
MTPYSLISAVNYISSCQDISNRNPGITSTALKQGNSQALQLRLNYTVVIRFSGLVGGKKSVH